MNVGKPAKSKKRQRQRHNKLAGRSVKVVVCSAPSDNINPALPMIKSGLLYGDQVHLHNPNATMLVGLRELGTGPPEHIIDVLIGLADGDLASLDATKVDSIRNLIDQVGEVEAKRRLVRSIDQEAMDQVRSELITVANAQLVESGFSPLARAIDEAVLTVLPTPFDDDFDGYLSEIASMLKSPELFVLLDDQLAGLFAHAVDRTVVGRGISRSTQVGAAHFLMGQLPTFPAAPVDEILDLRSKLRGPLLEFRSQMIRSTTELQLNVTDDDFQGAAFEMWDRDVAPALQDIDECIRDTGFARSHRRTATRVALKASAVMFVGFTTHEWTVAALSGASLAAAEMVLNNDDARRDRRRAARRNPYFFLHALNTDLK